MPIPRTHPTVRICTKHRRSWRNRPHHATARRGVDAVPDLAGNGDIDRAGEEGG